MEKGRGGRGSIASPGPFSAAMGAPSWAYCLVRVIRTFLRVTLTLNPRRVSMDSPVFESSAAYFLRPTFCNTELLSWIGENATCSTFCNLVLLFAH